MKTKTSMAVWSLAALLGFVLLAGCGKKEEQPAAAPSAAAPAAAATPIDPATAASISGTVKLDGEAPKAAKIDMSQDPACKGTNTAENVVAAGGHNVFSRVRAFAGGILAHVNLGGLGGFAIEFHGAADAGGRGGINRSGCGRRRCSAGSSGGLFFLLAASCEENKSQQGGKTPNCHGCFRFHDFVVPLLNFKA